MTLLSFALDRALHGTNAAGFHLTNVALHALNAVLLARLLARAGMTAVSSMLAALLWALVPRLTEAVAWISGRTDVLATTFVLAALLIRGDQALRRWAAALFLLLGLLSKEVSVAGLCALVALELTATSETFARRLARALPYLTAGGLYAALRLNAIGTGTADVDVGLRERLPAVLEAVGRYTISVGLPWLTDTHAGRVLEPEMPYAVFGGVVLAGGLGCAIWKRRSLAAVRGNALVGCILFVVGIALVVHVVPIPLIVVSSDRFLYLPLAGLTLATAPGLAIALARSLSPRVRVPGLIGLIGSFAIVSAIHTSRWSDEIAFWFSAHQKNERQNGSAVIGLGNIYFRAGLHAHAATLYASLRDRDRVYVGGAQANLAITLECLGRYSAAGSMRRASVRTRPDVPRYRLDLAVTELREGNLAAAERELTEALRLYPSFERAKSLRSQIPELRTKAPQSTGGDPLEPFHRAARLAKTRDAVQILVKLAEARRFERRSAEEALLFALKYADPSSTRTIYQGYLAAVGEPPPGLVEAVRLREEAARRLLERWPELGLELIVPENAGRQAARSPAHSPSLSR